MKTSTMRSLFAVATLAVAATASAQTYKVDVPVAFTVVNQTMPAGAYEVRLLTNYNGHPVVAVHNTASSRNALLTTTPGNDVPKAWKAAGNAVISFECLDGNCALRQIWDGENSSTYHVPGPKLKPAEVQRITALTLTLTKAD